MKHYRVKQDTNYYKDIEEARLNVNKFYEVSKKVREEFGLPESSNFSISPDQFYQPPSGLSEEQKKRFKLQDDIAKIRSPYHKRHVELIKEAGLTDAKPEHHIHFAYGIMRARGETLRRISHGGEYLIETDAEFRPNVMELLEEITHEEFLERQLELVRKHKEENPIG